MNPLAFVVAIFAFIAVIFIVRALLVPPQSESDLLEARLAQFSESGHALTTLAEVEMSLPFFERAIRPTIDRFGNALNSRMGARSAQALQEKLNLAGRPMGLSPGGFQAMRILAVIVFLMISYLIAQLLNLTDISLLLALAFGLVLGALLPVSIVSRAARKRQKEILKGLPSALDLLTISVEAGLGFDAAISRVTEKYKNALALEFNQFLNEIRLGRPRAEAMTEMGRRTQVEELNNFVQAVVQSEQLGVGIANVLRIQSEEIRRRRRQRAEEQGQKAPLKMLFPMVGCIFPTLFIVLLGPAALQVANSFSH